MSSEVTAHKPKQPVGGCFEDFVLKITPYYNKQLRTEYEVLKKS